MRVLSSRGLTARVAVAAGLLVALCAGVAAPSGAAGAGPELGGPAPLALGLPAPEGVTGSIVRLYLGALGRPPDPDGLRFWVARYGAGLSLDSIAAAFADSPDYAARFAGPDAAFVAALYREVLGRDPDPAGESSWIAALAAGTSRAAALVAFTESGEFVARSHTVEPTAPYRPMVPGMDLGVSDRVLRLFVAMLGRLPTPDELGWDAGRLARGTSLDALGDEVAGSPEFAAHAGGPLDDASFVALLFRQALGREPDADGSAHWASLLGAGTRRGEVAADLSDSAEMVARTVTAAPAAPAGGPVVYFTFDDGPDPVWTPQVLDVLARHQAQATFFELGRFVGPGSALVAEQLRHGDAIGNHTWDHSRLTKLATDAIDSQLESTSAALAAADGHRPVCLRPPYGSLDARLAPSAAAHGMSVVLWTVDPQDWRMPGVDAIVSRVLARVRNGSIVLMHDGGIDRSQTVAALDRLLTVLGRAGYRFAALPC